MGPSIAHAVTVRSVEIRELASTDLSAVLALNNVAVPAVNPHDANSLEALVDTADRCWVVDDAGTLGGLLVSFAPGADYASRNYSWLSERYDNFGYVDRIVVAATHRRLGVAGRLYNTLAHHAASHGRDRLLCEVNLDPPNPQSIAFHTATGWVPIADLEHEPGKVVRFFERPLGS